MMILTVIERNKLIDSEKFEIFESLLFLEISNIFQSQKMTAFTLVNDPINQLLIKFGSELSELFDNTQSTTVEGKKAKVSKAIAMNTSNTVRIVTFNGFRLLLYKDNGEIFIEIQNLLQHITSWGHPDGLHGFTANLDKVKETIDSIPAPYNRTKKIQVIGLCDVPICGWFVPVASLFTFVNQKYRPNLLKFMEKDFVSSDYEGWIYLNDFTDKNGGITKYKCGRTEDIKDRNIKYKSEANKNDEQCKNVALIHVKETILAENYLKELCKDYPNVKKLQKGKSEYLGISKDPKISKEQIVSIFKFWNDFATSKVISSMSIDDISKSLVKFDVLEESPEESKDENIDNQ